MDDAGGVIDEEEDGPWLIEEAGGVDDGEGGVLLLAVIGGATKFAGSRCPQFDFS